MKILKLMIAGLVLFIGANEASTPTIPMEIARTQAPGPAANPHKGDTVKMPDVAMEEALIFKLPSINTGTMGYPPRKGIYNKSLDLQVIWMNYPQSCFPCRPMGGKNTVAK